MCWNSNAYHHLKTPGRLASPLMLVQKSIASLKHLQKCFAAHSWMKCILAALQKCFIVESAASCLDLKWKRTCWNTMLLNLQNMSRCVEKNNKELFSTHSATVFGDWSTGGTRYVKLFAKNSFCSHLSTKTFVSVIHTEGQDKTERKYVFWFLFLTSLFFHPSMTNFNLLVHDYISTNCAFLKKLCFFVC